MVSLPAAPVEAALRAAALRVALAGGGLMPQLGLGTWLGRNPVNEGVTQAVAHALKCGYRHVDTAAIYGDEVEVGKGVKLSGVPRSDVFITTKLWNNKHRPSDVMPALEESLKKLDMEYVDLYLIHWPYAENAPDVTIPQTWQAMEECQKSGKARNIGVCNFSQAQLQELLKIAEIKPCMLQVELHPWLQQQALVDFCKKEGIAVTGYMPFGNLNRFNTEKLDTMTVDDPELNAIAKELGISVNQLCISWAIQRGTVTIPKSVTPHRILHNFAYFPLDDAVMQRIAKLDKQCRFTDPGKRWGVKFFE